MKKSLLFILPVATMALVGCKRGSQTSTSSDSQASQSDPTSSMTSSTQQTPSSQSSVITGSNNSSVTGSTQQTPSSKPSVDTEPVHPASPWPAVPQGDGSEASPWNVSQAWEYVDTQLEKTFETDASKQAAVKSKQEYYVRGYVCFIQAHSDGRDPNHPHSVQFHMADDVHHVTEEEVMNKYSHVRQGFCVYFADFKVPFSSQEEAQQIDRKLVTVKGYLLNWGYEPEITSNGTIVEIGPEAPTH